MATPVYKTLKSPRHGFAFDRIPSVRGSIHGGSVTRYHESTYAAILDCVYEMADQIASGNGVTHSAAINQVLKDEQWTILPTHKAAILVRLSA